MTLINMPANPQRIVLVNPTKFLGNLLLAGDLIQQYSAWCRQRDIQLMVVLDESFRPLMESAFSGITLVYYPRKQLLGRSLKGVLAYIRCVREIRAFEADLAFNIEEDSICHRLTLLSAARYRVSSTEARSRWGFHAVLPVSRVDRPEQRKHIWHSYHDIFTALGMASSTPQYISLKVAEVSAELRKRLLNLGVILDAPLAALHAGATKDYKRWPVEHFSTLARQLMERGYQVVLIGAGQADADANAVISRAFAGSDLAPVDLCDQFTLPELASFFMHVQVIIGNDSGPFHLASSLRVPGIVVFGPTDSDIWAPLDDHSTVLSHKELCHPTCRRRVCYNNYNCLKAVTPDEVLEHVPPPAASTAKRKRTLRRHP